MFVSGNAAEEKKKGKNNKKLAFIALFLCYSERSFALMFFVHNLI